MAHPAHPVLVEQEDLVVVEMVKIMEVVVQEMLELQILEEEEVEEDLPVAQVVLVDLV